jgi:hypothetical protein
VASNISPYFELTQKVLSGLAKVRMESGAWLDSESEELGQETQVFKIGECLRPFYLVAKQSTESSDPLPLGDEILLKDTEQFFRFIEKNKFFPSPYSPIPGAVDQYTDFAAFTLNLCDLVHNYWQNGTNRSKRVINYCEEIASTALDFLLAPEHRLVDSDGCRWGGTSKFSRTKKTIELYTNTYFTSVVVIALNEALGSKVLELNQARRSEISDAIRQAGKWIVERFDSQYITGDEANTNRQLLHSTWGLRALVSTYNLQDKSTQKKLPAITSAYLDILRSRENFSFEQEYLTILSEEVDAPLYYEDRSGLGGILLAITCLRNIDELERLLDESSHSFLTERVISAVMSLRNSVTGLWYSQQLILSIHSYLIEAFLMLDRQEKSFGGKIEVAGYMVRSAVREAFADENIINSLEQAVYDKLLLLVKRIEQDHAIKDEFGKILTASGGQQRHPNGKRSRKQTGISRKK